MDPEQVVIRFESSDRPVSAVLTSLLKSLERPDFDRIKVVILSVVMAYGPEEAVRRLDNRSVASLLAEYPEYASSQPEVTGEQDGVRYRLYGPPTGPQGNADS